MEYEGRDYFRKMDIVKRPQVTIFSWNESSFITHIAQHLHILYYYIIIVYLVVQRCCNLIYFILKLNIKY